MDIQAQTPSEILLIGDSCIDVYVFGDCSRLSPEAPVPILKKTSKIYKSGMVSNVFENMSSLYRGKIDLFCNPKEKIKKIRFVDSRSGQQIMRYDIEKKIELLNFADLPNKNYEAVVISDYDKGYITDDCIRSIRQKYDCPIFIDSKKKDPSAFAGCILKCNEKEYSELSIKADNIDVVITLGAKGARWKNKVYPAQKVDVHDVCGAGDVFLASMVTRWLETNDMELAIKTANLCAALSVTKMGTYQLTREDYENLRI